MNAFKYLKIAAFTFLSMLLLAQINAQNPNLDYKYGIRIYNTTSRVARVPIQLINGTDTFFFRINQLRFLDPGIGFQLKGKKENFHEIQLSGIKCLMNAADTIRYGGKPRHSRGSRNTQFSAGIRYEYDLVLLKRKNKRIMPTLGFYGNLFVDSWYFNDNNPVHFKSRFKDYHIYTGVVPGVLVYVGKRIFLSAQIPITVYDFSWTRNRMINPSLTPAQQKTTSYGFNSPISTDWAIRLGVGIKL